VVKRHAARPTAVRGLLSFDVAKVEEKGSRMARKRPAGALPRARRSTERLSVTTGPRLEYVRVGD
jgi:hypothetical protein